MPSACVGAPACFCSQPQPEHTTEKKVGQQAGPTLESPVRQLVAILSCLLSKEGGLVTGLRAKPAWQP